MIQRLSTAESLDYLEKNNVKISERTFRRYKSEVLEIQNALEVYSWGHIQEEQIQKMETKQTILKESWKLYQSATKPSEKLAILKAIEKTSDELPEVKKARKKRSIKQYEDGLADSTCIIGHRHQQENERGNNTRKQFMKFQQEAKEDIDNFVLK